MHLGPQPGSLTQEIIRLHHEGVGQREIARRLGCTQPNVFTALKRHLGGGPISFPVLAREQMNWLRDEAARQKVPVNDLARAMLIDAIADAMEKRK